MNRGDMQKKYFGQYEEKLRKFRLGPPWCNLTTYMF